MGAARGSSILIRLSRNIHFKQHRTQLLLVWPIELSSLSIVARSFRYSVYWRVDFTISVITLFVVFDESFQKALVNKSVCVINIVHLIILPSTKNPLFDVYFSGSLHFLQVRFILLWGQIWDPSHSLHGDFRLPWAHIWDPPHSLHWYFSLLWGHIWDPPHSRHWYLYFPCFA